MNEDLTNFKYSLDDLFENTPVFEVPDVITSEYTKPWKRIKDMIFSPFNDTGCGRYVKTHIKFS